MEILEYLLVVIVGIVAGFFNTVAGGGSLISLPVLIFLGLTPNIANATNRVAIFSQNVFGVAGFKSKGVSVFPYSLWLGLSALLGAIIGAKIAVDIDPQLFNKILAVIMILVVINTVLKLNKKKDAEQEKTNIKHKAIGIFTFFFIGIYGGFIQAGVGFLIIAALTQINGFSLVKTNAAKMFVVMIYTTAALLVFIIEDQINWIYGITLAIGNSTGAWLASRWHVKKGDKTVSRILVVMVIALAIKLWFF